MRWSQDEFTIAAVLELKQVVAIAFVAARLFPQIGRQQCRQHHFNGTSLVHFFANDVFNLANHAVGHWQISPDPGRDLVDVAGPHHHLMTERFCISWCFFFGRNQNF